MVQLAVACDITSSSMLHCARRGLLDTIPGLRLANRVISVGGTESQSAAADHIWHSQLCCLQSFHQQTHCLYSSSSPQHAASGQNSPMPPWTPTAQLTKRKVLTKRMGFLLQASKAHPDGSGLKHLPVCLYFPCYTTVAQWHACPTDTGGRTSCCY